MTTRYFNNEGMEIDKLQFAIEYPRYEGPVPYFIDYPTTGVKLTTYFTPVVHDCVDKVPLLFHTTLKGSTTYGVDLSGIECRHSHSREEAHKRHGELRRKVRARAYLFHSRLAKGSAR